MTIKFSGPWVAISAVLFVIALYLRFALHGYSYLAYTLVLAVFLIGSYHIFPKFVYIPIYVLVIIGIIYFCIVEIPIIRNSKTDLNCEKKYLIVLGAEVVGSTPSRSLNYRINAAEEYLNKYPDCKAIVSGGKGSGENISEAECMYNVLTQRGISTDRIIIEERATSTLENLSYSFDIIRSLGDDPANCTAICSSSYHLYRAKSMASSLGCRCAGVAAYPGNPFLAANFYIREAFGITHLWVFGE